MVRASRNVPKATIWDIAERAGVSIKTVSRVVNQEPNVRAETRAKVRAAVRALQYEPHPSARSLASKRTFSIGVIYETPLEFSYVKKLLEGVFAVCEKSGYVLLLRPCNAEPTADDVRRFVTQTRIDGVLLPAPVGDSEEVTDTLVELDTPFVRISPRTVRDGWTSVSPDDEDACYALTEHVLSFGHSRIGFLRGDPRHGAAANRLAGYGRCLRTHGVTEDPVLAVDGRFDFESGKRGAHELLQLMDRPTAIIASNDDMAAGAIVAARELGLDVPKDLSVVGFDDSPTALHTWPPLTTVRQPIADIAGMAARFLIDRLRGEGDQPRHVAMACELVVRGSMAPLP